MKGVPFVSEFECPDESSVLRSNRSVIRVLLLAKLVLVLIVCFSSLAAFDVRQFRDAYASWPGEGVLTMESYFATWDGAHYLRLSEFGYKAGSYSCAFYPLWPGTIRAGAAAMGGRPLLASMVLANALSVLGFWLFYRLVERHWGAMIGRDALILMLAFPGALFFSFPYSESLYFVVLMIFFWGLELERWSWTALSGFLLSLARPLGVFVVLPLAVC